VGNRMEMLKKLKVELPYDSAIPLLGIYIRRNVSHNTIKILAH
jgi:hypothetical protein